MQDALRTQPSKDSDLGLTYLYQHLMKIQQDWDIDDKTLAKILGKDNTNLSKWKRLRRLPKLGRNDEQVLQSIFAIHRSLNAIFSNQNNERAWLKTPSPDLNSRETPVKMMIDRLENLFTIRAYLDFMRGKGA